MKKTLNKFLSLALMLVMLLGIGVYGLSALSITTQAAPPSTPVIVPGTHTVGKYTYYGGAGQYNNFTVTLSGVTSDATTVKIPEKITVACTMYVYYDDEDVDTTALAKITAFSDNILFNCPNNTSYQSDCSLFKVTDGVLYDASGKGMVSYPQGKSSNFFIIPTNVTKFYKNVFNNCKNLKIIRYPDLYSKFIQINGYQNVIQSATNSTVMFQKRPYWYSVKNNEVTIEGCYTTDTGTITVPSTIDGLPVTGIAKGAFDKSYCPNIQKIRLPSSIVTIPNRAFDGASQLQSIFFSSVSSSKYTSVPINNNSNYHMLYTNDKETLLRYPPAAPFTNVIVNDRTEIIGDSAFDGCAKLKTIDIPSTVTEIKNYAFNGCSALSTVNFKGCKRQWDKITIGSLGNTKLSGANIICATKEYKVEFYDGSNYLGEKYMNVGTSYPLSYGSVPSTNYHTFKGWSKTRGSTTVEYTDGQSVTNLSTTDGAIVKLYAVWEISGTLTSIKVKTPPKKTVYTENQLFDETGMIVEANYSNGYKKQIYRDDDYTVSPVGGLTIGTTSVTIRYIDGWVTKTATVPITVRPLLAGISIKTMPKKGTYYEGDNFDKSGMVVVAYYTNRTTAVITDYTIINGTNLTVGQSSVTIKHTDVDVEITETVPIIVKEKNKIDSFAVIGVQKPVTGSAYRQDTDIVLVNCWSCSRSKDGYDEFGVWFETSTKPTTCYEAKNGTLIDKNDSNFKFKADKYYTLIMAFKADPYWKFTNSFSATVNGNKANVEVVSPGGFCRVWYCFGKPVSVTGIEITSAPSNTELQYKSSAPTDGLRVVEKYSDGTSQDITYKVTVKDFSANNKKGNYTATVEYEGKTATFDYSVKYSFGQWLIIIFLFGWIWY